MVQRVLAAIVVFALCGVAGAATGFNEGYTVAYGDLNGDNLRDLYVRPPTKVVPISLDEITVLMMLPSTACAVHLAVWTFRKARTENRA